MCKDPILCYFDSNKQYFIETDFSDYVNTDVLSQIGENNLLHTVAYFLRRIVPAKCYYKIYDKKFLALFDVLKMEARVGKYRPTSESAYWPQGLKVLYDHQEVNPAASKVGRIPIRVQFCDQLLE